MVFPISPTTELEAINKCLGAVGEAPVVTLSEENLGVTAEIALNLLRSNSRLLQTRGWYWNSETNYPLNPAPSGDILTPPNTLSVDPSDSQRDIVARGHRLYDRENRTYLFTEAVEVDLILGLPFEELPEAARQYLIARTSRMLEDHLEGSSESSDSEDERLAYAILHADQLRVEDNNLLSDDVRTVILLSRY